ncbi:helix-turn-helix domain-containing protein [Gottfriedia sp. NPDC057948]|uniref:helix-turn-helix domain-containing protein n=1 Tax=Gottfriedia sp. NPDC057948 TaxID=3346287 RepID=UPI0036DBA9BB
MDSKPSRYLTKERYQKILKLLEKYHVNTETGEVSHKKSGRIRKFTVTPKGYERTRLSLDNGEVISVFKHQLVAIAGGLNPVGKVINHIDGNKLNNSLKNLEVVTNHENVLHAWKTGLVQAKEGEDHPLTNLKNHDICEIRRLYVETQMNFTEIGEKYGISSTMVGSIVRRESWDHVDDGLSYDIKELKKNKPSKMPKGENHHFTKLTEEIAIRIRKAYKMTDLTSKQIAEKFGVSEGVVLSLINGTSWSHINDGIVITKEDKQKRLLNRKLPKGEENHASKLTENLVREIRKLYGAGQITIKQLAERYSVSQSVVFSIVHRQTWKNVKTHLYDFGGPEELKKALKKLGNKTKKLTEEQVKEIRLLHKEGMSKAAIARKFGIGETTASDIIDRRTWKDVD